MTIRVNGMTKFPNPIEVQDITIGRGGGAIDNNTIVGRAAGQNNTSGYANVFIGQAAGQNNTTGHANTFIGQAAGLSNTTGSQNTFIGRAVGYSNTTGHANTFIGWAAGYSNTTGSRVILIGAYVQNRAPDANGVLRIGHDTRIILEGDLDDVYADGETALLLRRNVGGVFSLVRISMGAPDSGGTGYRILRVPN
jgi:hypothetical protein